LESIFVTFLLVSFAGRVCYGFWHQTTGACLRRQKQAPETGQCVITIRYILRSDLAVRWLGGVTFRTLDSRLTFSRFDCQLGCYPVVTGRWTISVCN